MTDQPFSAEPMQPEVLSSPPRARGRALALGAASVIGGLTIGMVGMAAATGTPDAAPAQLQPAVFAQESPSQLPTPAPSTDAVPKPGKRGWGGHHRGGIKGMGGAALHGEFVTKKADGTYQTVQMQQGTATAVSATSITVKSEDGFTRSYAVTKDTLVNAGPDGISSIAVNAKVHVQAIGAGGSATAAHVVDEAKMMAMREKFAPERKKPTADATKSNT